MTMTITMTISLCVMYYILKNESGDSPAGKLCVSKIIIYRPL